MQLVEFIRANWPTWGELLLHGPVMLFWAFAALTLAGCLKRRWALPTGYTRKVFHFVIFCTAAALQAVAGTRAVCLFGAMTTIPIAYAALRGDGNLHYEGIAREKDAPRRTYYIVTPYIATLLGGLLTTILFGNASIVGFLVTGVGDAIGEPVGTRFGRHPYRVPSMRGVVCTRTLEGSASVFLVSMAAALVAVYLRGAPAHSLPSLLGVVLLIGIASALCEAVSPHGWDNFTVQAVPTAIAFTFM